MGTKVDEKLRWERLPGGKDCQPFEEEGDDKEKKPWIDSTNVYDAVKLNAMGKQNNARN